MKSKFVFFITLSLCSTLSFAEGELSCKKIVPINVTEAWKRSCSYNGSSLNEAYQEYRSLTQNLGDAPYTLPNTNRKFKVSSEVEVNIVWKGKNRVFVSQIYPEAENSGMEVSFKKVGRKIQIEETGWTP